MLKEKSSKRRYVVESDVSLQKHRQSNVSLLCPPSAAYNPFFQVGKLKNCIPQLIFPPFELLVCSLSHNTSDPFFKQEGKIQVKVCLVCTELF